MPQLDVLYEDNHLLVVDKPAGIPTMGSDGPTVHAMAAEYLKRKFNKPGRAFVGIVSRLDQMTSGVLVLARTSKAAARLSAQFAGQSAEAVQKIYLAVLAGHVVPPQGRLVDSVWKDDASRRMRVVDRERPGAQTAELGYCTVGIAAQHSLVAARLLTGRKHQIRLQFADRDHPIVGDRKYGSREKFAAGIALHSWHLGIAHPTRQERMIFEAAPPKSWNRFQHLLPLPDELRRMVGGLTDGQRRE